MTPEEKHKLFIFTGSLLILGGIMSVLLYTQHKPTNEMAQVANEGGAQSTDVAHTAFDTLKIEAQAAYVFDGKTGKVLYAKNAEQQLPLASLTKLMTAIVTAENATWSEHLVIKQNSLAADGDNGLRPGDTWTILDLLQFTLVVSSNDGALALAHKGTKESTGNRKSFLTEMNRRAKVLGLEQTYFLNSTGLDSTTEISGGYGSARDAAHLLQHALRIAGPALEATRFPDLSYQPTGQYTYRAQNTNQLVTNIPGLMASKTGFTDLAGGNLVIAIDVGINHPIFLAVLGSTQEGRFSDIETLVQKTFETLALQ